MISPNTLPRRLSIRRYHARFRAVMVKNLRQMSRTRCVFLLSKCECSSLRILCSLDMLCFQVPKDWTLLQAASVPVVYSTAYYALNVRANLRPGESVLIHSGSGGVGQAAISICLKMGCEVFTTVGTKEKREYLMATFPELKPENIGNSRDLSFEQMVSWVRKENRKR